jgi:hypothetical protein
MSRLIDDLLISDQRRRANGGGSTPFWRMLRYDCNIPQNQRSCAHTSRVLLEKSGSPYGHRPRMERAQALSKRVDCW